MEKQEALRNFAANLHEQLAISGLTQIELARRLEITKGQINNYSRRRSLPSVMQLIQMCEIFNCEANDLLKPNKGRRCCKNCSNQNKECDFELCLETNYSMWRRKE